MAIIGCLVGVVLLVLILWAIISPHEVIVKQLEKEASVNINAKRAYRFA